MLAWQHTTGAKFVNIIECGWLMPANAGVTPPERLVAWFSTNPAWEQTASKWLLLPDHSGRGASMQETRQLGCRLVRFGMAPKGLRTGDALRRAALISRSVWRLMENEGRRQGTELSEWFGFVGAIPVEALEIEVLDFDDSWKRVVETADSGSCS